MNRFTLVLGLLIAFVCADDSLNKMLEKQLMGTAKYGNNKPTSKPIPKPVPTPRPTIAQKVIETKWYEDERFRNTISGDRRIDALFEGFGISVVFDIDRNNKKIAGYCSHSDNSIHMKPIDYYYSNDYYVGVLLHELGHCIDGANREINYKYDSEKQNYQWKVEEMIADKYSIKMAKYLGYKSASYRHSRIKDKQAKLKTQGAMMGSIDFYVSGQVNSAISKSKAIIGRKRK